jgi:hypothetical protein
MRILLTLQLLLILLKLDDGVLHDIPWWVVMLPIEFPISIFIFAFVLSICFLLRDTLYNMKL